MQSKRIANHVYTVGKFECRHRFILTRDVFNLMVCAYGWGFAVLRHIELSPRYAFRKALRWFEVDTGTVPRGTKTLLARTAKLVSL